MKFKIFLKKMNRGVALGIAVLIAFAIYIKVDKVLFTREKPELEVLFNSYVEEMCKASIDTPAIQVLEKPYTEENVAERENQILAVASKYWDVLSANYNEWNGRADYSNFTNGIYTYGYLLKQDKESGKGYITNNQPFITDISIKKTGPIYASIEYSYQCVVKYVGSPMLVSIGAIKHLGPSRWNESSYLEWVGNDDGSWKEMEYSNDGILVYVAYADAMGQITKSEKYDENGLLVQTWDGIRPANEVIKPKPADPEVKTETVKYEGTIQLIKVDGEWLIDTIEEIYDDSNMY